MASGLASVLAALDTDFSLTASGHAAVVCLRDAFGLPPGEGRGGGGGAVLAAAAGEPGGGDPLEKMGGAADEAADLVAGLSGASSGDHFSGGGGASSGKGGFGGGGGAGVYGAAREAVWEAMVLASVDADGLSRRGAKVLEHAGGGDNGDSGDGEEGGGGGGGGEGTTILGGAGLTVQNNGVLGGALVACFPLSYR